MLERRGVEAVEVERVGRKMGKGKERVGRR